MLKEGTCEVCGKKFEYYVKMQKGRFCSTECRLKWLSQNNIETKSPNDLEETILASFGYQCERCGCDDHLQVCYLHGIDISSLSFKSVLKHPEYLTVLCSKCFSKAYKEVNTWGKQNIDNSQIVKGFAMVLEGLSKKYKNLDLSDPNLEDTPNRIARAWLEMLEGLDTDPEEIICSSAFPSETYDEMILLRNIEFSSICSHHFLPFIGTADVAYIPDTRKGKIIGISKLARLVDCFAKRPQLQERMAENIANSLVKYLEPLGVAVRIQAKHLCISCRGAKKINSVMVTSSLKGVFRDNASSRAEFLTLIQQEDK